MVKRVGVIGGGQLAWMMASGAKTLGIELIIQTPKPDDPAVGIAADTIFAPVADAAATAELAKRCDVITFENEFVDHAALSQLEQAGVVFYPTLRSLTPLLDKYHLRRYLVEHELPTPRFINVEASREPDWAELLSATQFPVVLKTRRLGYDGQGTVVVQNIDALRDTWNLWERQPLIVEEFVPFERELAVMAARSPSGEIVLYPVVETQQEQQVCRRVFVLQDWPDAVTAQVEAIARSLLDRLDYVGIMGIEFFLTKTGQVLVNETAPRTHNSGHYSLDACVTSQFEQQLRAVSGLPLGNPSLTCAAAVMVNLLGFESAESEYLEKREAIAALPNAHVYWYGKSQSRPGRKLGHVTVCSSSANRGDLEAIAQQVEALWYPKHQAF